MEGDDLTALFRDASFGEAFVRGLHSAPVARAADECMDLTMDAFRCADLQGHRNPLCLDRKDKMSRCMGRFLAPEFVERLELCERLQGEQNAPTKCSKYREDLSHVVHSRSTQYVNDLEFSVHERRAVQRCGVPSTSRSQGEYHQRVACMAPFVCSQLLDEWRACELKSPGKCAGYAEDLLECLGVHVSKINFRQP